MEILVDAKGPMLHHCTAGKDRTGIGSTIIFLILDLPIETIMEDLRLIQISYLKSICTEVAGKNERIY